ncbi:carbohydrate ABC transporter membrane protein 1, CUT1 family [Faunimonas pinastri]|uniref:Carbohydrate ABC transporter membrane protein 1, CUT1 family n=1 Tax=Faunimonas pinastri TaxID=1855383 RepID=A0A1H9IEF4_9HYPH|nr:sugar ABC transporter permease [Faunimonas pinastri]SEQ72934.1 carbohydrate ABC transporter membrane protein 1, CUT1 family [Faunimonas pinastri]
MTAFFRTFREGSGFDAVLILCAVAYLLVFSAFPLVYNVIMSFQSVDMFSITDFNRPWVGWQNYIDVINRPEAWLIVKNTAIFVLLSIVFQLGLGFGLALLFQQDFPAATFLRGLFLAGWIMPGLVVGTVWKWIFAGDFGVLNYVLNHLGIVTGKIFWLSDPAYSLYAVIIANIWLGIPFNMILLSVGLAAIPRDIYEAAELDGATAFQRFFSMTLPMMRATLGAVVSLGVILTLQQFDLIAGLTKGGPANSSNVAQYWSWQLSFETYEISAGSVIAVMMIAVVIVVATIYVRSTTNEQSA